MFKSLKQRLTEKFPVGRHKMHDLYDVIMEHLGVTGYEGGQVAEIVAQQLEYEGLLETGIMHFKMKDENVPF
jgi:hypothetical protein